MTIAALHMLILRSRAELVMAIMLISSLWIASPAIARQSATPAPAAAPAPARPELLIFSHTTGFRHKSIPQGIAQLAVMATDKGYRVTASEDLDLFTADNLARYRAIILLSNTTKPDDPASDYLTGDRLAAFQAWSEAGGAIVGIHAATDSHYHTPWYAGMIGAQFLRHPRGTHDGMLTVTAPGHPAVRRLAARFIHRDEWYQLRSPPDGAEVLVTLDPASAGEPGPAWPVSWTTRTGKGRNFVTTMGHTVESFSDPLFMAHVADGLDWAVSAE